MKNHAKRKTRSLSESTWSGAASKVPTCRIFRRRPSSFFVRKSSAISSPVHVDLTEEGPSQVDGLHSKDPTEH